MSVGLGIELPFEQGLNDWVDIGIDFRYFFVRKTMFVKYAQAFVVCPAGSARWTSCSRRSRWCRPARSPASRSSHGYGLLGWPAGVDQKTLLAEGKVSPETSICSR
jgi:hypothetical protein